MVVGHGLIAKAFSEFEQDEEFLFFCSGVSNSMCRDQSEFDREKNLLQEHIVRHGDKTFIYFSTCSIGDPSMKDSLYRKHKLEVEAIIAASCDRYYIFRLSNVVGRTANTVTILNFLYNAIKSGRHFDLWRNSNRNLIDVEDAAAIVKRVLGQNLPANTITNVANPRSYDVPDIVREIERYLGLQGAYTLADKGVRFEIPISAAVQNIIQELQIDFGDNYLPALLEKYYPQ
jgi:nucleoside-diphosphate-sugar epimerase